jgi:hypothetical protein
MRWIRMKKMIKAHPQPSQKRALILQRPLLDAFQHSENVELDDLPDED